MHPPREINASPDEIRQAPLADFLAMLGKQDLLIGGKHARKKIIKHLRPEAGQRIGLSMPLDSERFDDVELLGPEAEELDALALHHLSIGASQAIDLHKGIAGLKSGDRLVLHDVIWRQTPPESLAEEAKHIWQCPIEPATVAELWQRLETAGLEDITLDIGAFAWFRTKQFARDEGKYAPDILFNALNNPAARERYLAALDHFRENDRFYGYVVISGVKGQQA